MLISPPPGLQLDQPLVSSEPHWHSGMNIRFRLGRVETMGLFGPMRLTTGAQIVLPGTAKYRHIFTTPSPTTGQVLCGSTSSVRLLQFDPATSTPGAPPRWAMFDVTPSPLATASDTLTDPNAGRIEIPPVWWFTDQDDVVVGNRANVPTDPPYYWDRVSTNRFKTIPASRSPMDPQFANGWTGPPGVDGAPAADPAHPPTPIPHGAVGGGIINRILVLLGASSFTDPDPLRFMTIRWSTRHDFGQWTPSDVTISGELQLEGGSRIVGGGYTAFGIMAWTDRRLALLTETFDPDSVFNRRYIDGSRGLLANKAWCEADGVVWWLDEARVLNAFDGGRPRQIPNPLKSGTVERVTDKDCARIYLQGNPEYGEVLIWMPSGVDSPEPDACLVFNYIEDAWSYWRMTRTAWCSRYGVIPALAISDDGKVWRHDLDVSMPSPWIDALRMVGNGKATPPIADVEPFDFWVSTNLITTGDVTSKTWRGGRIMLDHIPSPAVGAEADQIKLTAVAFGEATLLATNYTDEQMFIQGQAAADFRVEGKALMLLISGDSQRTVWRFGAIDVTAAEGGQR